MADTRRSVISPDGVVGTVPDDQYEGALAAGYKPAAEQDVSAATARSEQSGVAGFGKALLESGAELFNPADVVAGLLQAPGPTELASLAAEKLGASDAIKKAIKESPVGLIERGVIAPARRAVFETVRPVVEPLTTGRLETGLGLTTPEAIEARKEEHPYAGLALLPLFLARGKLPSITRAATAADALAAERVAVNATLRAGAAAAEAEAGGITARQALKIQDDALKLAEKAAKSRKLAKLSEEVFEANPRLGKAVEGVASGKYTGLGMLERVGAPVRQATEASVRSALELAPGMGARSQAVKDIVARSVANGLGSATEMAFYGLGQAANEAALGDHELTTERALASMGEGALGGFVLGAGITGAAGTAKLAAQEGFNAARSGRDWLVKNFPKAAAAITGAAPESASVALRNRERVLEGANLAELIEESMPAPVRPIEPTVITAPTLPEMPEVTQITEPTLASPKVKAASRDLADGLRRMFSVFEDLSKEAQGKILKERSAGAVTDFYDGKVAEAKARYLELAGAPKTPKAMADFESIPEVVTANARSYLRNRADAAQALLDKLATDIPGAQPTTEMNKLQGIVNDAYALAANRNARPSDVFLGIKEMKQRAFSVARPKTQGPPPTVTPEQKAARDIADDVGHIFRSANQNTAAWGETAALEEEGNAIWTDLSDDMKALYQAFSREEVKGFKGKKKDISTKKVLSWVKGLADAEDGQINIGGADSVDTLRIYSRAMRNLETWHDYVVRAADQANYGDAKNLTAMSEAMAGARQAYAAAEQQAVLRTSNSLAKSDFKALEAQRKQLVKQLKSANKAERASVQAEIDAVDARNDALREQFKIEEAEYKEAMKARSLAAKEEAKLLQRSGSQNVSDALALGGGFGVGLASGLPYVGLPIAAGIKIGSKVASAEKALKTIAFLERAARKTEMQTKEVANAVVSGTPSAVRVSGATSAALSANEQRKLFKERSRKINEMMTDPEVMSNRIDQMDGGIADVAPNVSAHTKVLGGVAVSQLAAEMPQPPASLAPYDKANWEPTDAQVRDWNQAYDVVANPSATMRRMAEGSVTVKEVRQFNRAYPSVAADLRRQVIENVRANPRISSERRRLMSMILGVNLDSQLSPQVAGVAQSVYAAPAQPEQSAQMPVSRAQGLGLANRAEYNTAARREAQRGVGSWNKRQ